jgi:hypothetical protein
VVSDKAGSKYLRVWLTSHKRLCFEARRGSESSDYKQRCVSSITVAQDLNLLICKLNPADPSGRAVSTSNRTQTVTITNIDLLTLFKEIVPV